MDDWAFFVILALMVPIVFLPPAFLMLRPMPRAHVRAQGVRNETAPRA